MTSPQLKRIYFPAWGRAFAANWQTVRGRIERTAPDTEWNTGVESVAEALARQAHSGLTADLLRHACNALAIRRARQHRAGDGRGVQFDWGHTSSADLQDRYDLSLGLFLALCDLLVDADFIGKPDRPGGRLAWDQPDLIERAWLLDVIRDRCEPGYVATLCASIYQRGHLELLGTPQLKDLYRTLGQRRNAWRPRGGTPAPVAASEAVETPY